MVAHNGGAYLPTVLAALAAQTRVADQVLAADTGSTDNSGELLRTELGERNVISLDGRRNRRQGEAHKGFGAAVDAVLEFQARQRQGVPDAARIPALVGASGTASDELPVCNEWIWLLHDDAAPAPDALQLLLEATERATTATVVGCKQLDWDNHRRLVDVGLQANVWFDRFTLVGMDEHDQGQHDINSDMFAVNTAGMLVRRDVFERLGGFDPALPGPGDDLDFCARVRLAGDRVLVVPAAHMFHVGPAPQRLGHCCSHPQGGNLPAPQARTRLGRAVPSDRHLLRFPVLACHGLLAQGTRTRAAHVCRNLRRPVAPRGPAPQPQVARQFAKPAAFGAQGRARE
ncbi:glycosyltransferase family 2 protein [Arthrobacter psychrolactophilus]